MRVPQTPGGFTDALRRVRLMDHVMQQTPPTCRNENASPKAGVLFEVDVRLGALSKNHFVVDECSVSAQAPRGEGASVCHPVLQVPALEGACAQFRYTRNVGEILFRRTFLEAELRHEFELAVVVAHLGDVFVVRSGAPQVLQRGELVLV